MSLNVWGWDENWERSFEPFAVQGLVPARVIRQDRGACEVQTEAGGRAAESTGRFRHALEQDEAEVPVAGDWVAVDPRPTCDRAGIEGVLPRRTCLSRQGAGRATREQVLAANVDIVFLVCALDGGRGFNLRRLERGLTLVRGSGAEAVIVLNKADLCEDVDARLRESGSVAPEVPVVAVSAIRKEGLEGLAAWMTGNRTVAMLGPSGVGKSALINALLDEERQDTGPVRESDSRGRHTTTRRELFRIPSGGILVDTAGLREFQPWGAGSELDDIFPEIAELAEQCRFRDCRHEGEPGCAVQQALGDGSLDFLRFDHYLRLKREQAYQEMRRDASAQQVEKARWKKIAQWQKEMYRHREK